MNQPINRRTVATINGFRTYGAFSATLDTDKDGNVVYSNVTEDSSEYKRMMNNNTKFRTNK